MRRVHTAPKEERVIRRDNEGNYSMERQKVHYRYTNNDRVMLGLALIFGVAGAIVVDMLLHLLGV